GPTLLPVPRHDLVWIVVPLDRCPADRTSQPGLFLGSRRTRIWVPRDESGLQRLSPPRRRHSAKHPWRAGPETHPRWTNQAKILRGGAAAVLLHLPEHALLHDIQSDR